MNALSIQGLVKRYRGREALTPAVNGVSLTVGLGETVGLIGESGCGKTTLARCALGLLPFQEGEVEVLDQPVSALARRPELRRQAQLLFQSPRAMLNPGLTVRAHLLESARLHRSNEAPADVVQEIAARVGLEHRLDALPANLSGGERRRAGLARLLVAQPRLLVADEPTAGLDAALKADLIDQITGGRRADRATLIISHDLQLVAYACARVVVMLAGRVIERCPTVRLGEGPHHPYTAELLAAAGLTRVRTTHTQAEAVGRRGPGCPYAGRCALTAPPCHTQAPPLTERAPGHWIACHHAPETDP
ncbi:MAG: ABC transporter ATP-binding protein [Alphaproteobacteria bacterium]|nr:ABC transporter ATP-binding protein [Alphaproteobacteria bacterium]